MISNIGINGNDEIRPGEEPAVAMDGHGARQDM